MPRTRFRFRSRWFGEWLIEPTDRDRWILKLNDGHGKMVVFGTFTSSQAAAQAVARTELEERAPDSRWRKAEDFELDHWEKELLPDVVGIAACDAAVIALRPTPPLTEAVTPAHDGTLGR